MASKHISQREARETLRKLRDLQAVESRRANNYASDYPGGTHIGSVSFSGVINSPAHAAYVARLLGHAVVVTCVDRSNFNLYAIPLPKEST